MQDFSTAEEISDEGVGSIASDEAVVSKSLGLRGYISLVVLLMLGISAWVGQNSVWAELFAIVPHQPESLSLASYLSIIAQCSNIIIPMYTYLPRKPPLWLAVLFVLSTSSVAMYLIAGLWSKTATVFGSPHSVGLFSTLFFLAMTEIMSNLVFFSYAAGFGPSSLYLTFLSMGEVLATAVPAALVGIQKASGFGTTTYFAIVGGYGTICCIAFLVLHFYLRPKAVEMMPIIEDRSFFSRMNLPFLGLFIQMAWLSLIQNSVTVTFLPFASRAYPGAYGLATNLLFACRSLASLAAAYVFNYGHGEGRLIKVLEIIALIAWNTFGILVILLSYIPPSDILLAGKSAGTAIFTAIMVPSGAAVSFSKLVILLRLRKYNTDGALKNAGVCIQIGSAVGAIIGFLLINFCKPPL